MNDEDYSPPYSKGGILGWCHCHPCGRSFGRFTFFTKNAFIMEESRRILCIWCKKATKTYHEKNDEIMLNSEFEIDIYGE